MSYSDCCQGKFPGVIHQPSKYAARIAQAFTATDPSVRITSSQWEEVPDLGNKPYEFTDGVGTISRQLGDLIWDALCAARRDHGKHAVKPSVVSFLKGGFRVNINSAFLSIKYVSWGTKA
jgi:RNA-dependent RNA polymerase